MTEPFILLAGATGDLGGRIAEALVARAATVHAVVRRESSLASRDRLAALVLEVVDADLGDIVSEKRAKVPPVWYQP